MAIIELDNGVQLEIADGLSDSEIDEIVDDYFATTSKELGVIDTFQAYSDAAGTVLSNIGGSIAGSTYGFAKGLYNAVDEGTYGTQKGVDTVRRTMAEVTDQFSKGGAYTPEGQAVLDSVAEAVAPVVDAISDFDRDARVLEPLAMLPASPLAPAYRTMAVSQGLPTAARETLRQTGEVATAPVRAAQAGYNRVTEPPANSRSIGSAETDKARERITTAQGLPIPFQGESGLTRGQATRDAGQLKFETEAARDNNADMQDRRRNQQATANQNFDAMEDDLEAPRFGSTEEQGAAVRSSLIAYKRSRKKEVDEAYSAAREAGETEELLPEIEGLNRTLQEAWRYRHGNPKNEAIWNAARDMKIIDEDGNLKPISIHEAEELRKYVNRTYDASVPAEAFWRRQFVDVIDSSLDSVPAGEKYAAARGLARDYYDEFDNSPLARDLDGRQSRSNTPKIADENVAKKVYSASNEQVRQLRDTLTSTQQGQATWRSIQAEFLNDIRKSAFGTQTSDKDGTPLLTAATFKKKVRDLDESGKLETMLGPQQAQYIRDLVEVAESIASLPPQVVNPGTAAELFRRIKGLAPAGLGAGVEMSVFGGLPIGSMASQAAAYAAQAAKVKKSLDGEGLLTEGMKQ